MNTKIHRLIASTTENELIEIFSPVNVSDVNIAVDRTSYTSRGFPVVMMDRAEGDREAIQALNEEAKFMTMLSISEVSPMKKGETTPARRRQPRRTASQLF